jgi:hypothetical protein
VERCHPLIRRPRPSPTTAARRWHDHLADARKLLCLANRKGIRIHHDVLSVVVQADRTCSEQGHIDLDLETRFWTAYGILRRTIQPATRARTYYRAVFYGALAVMLVFQCYFLFGSRVHEQVGKLQTEQLELFGAQKMQEEGSVAVARDLEEELRQNAQRQAAYRELALRLVPYSGWSVVAASDAEPNLGTLPDSRFEVAFATLKMILDFLAAYLLPALYGLLGACAFVLRQLSADLSRDFSTLRFAHDSRVRYSLRLNIGVLAGLAVGWFIDPTQEGSVVANLSPLALAFVAGYGSDLLFAVLDRIVNAFSTQPAAEASAPGAHPVTGLEAASEPRSAATGPRAAAASSSSNKASQRGKRSGTNGAHPEPEPAPAQ